MSAPVILDWPLSWSPAILAGAGRAIDSEAERAVLRNLRATAIARGAEVEFYVRDAAGDLFALFLFGELPANVTQALTALASQ
jgi:hypothetical protein